MSALLPWVTGGLIVLGLLILTLAVYGLVRMPSVYTRAHAASKAVFLGILPFLAAAALTGGIAARGRALLVAVFLCLTAPVGAHAIVSAARAREANPEPPEEHTDDPASE